MRLQDYPRPPADTGWGMHDSADLSTRPADPAGYARYLRQDLGVTWWKALVGGKNKPDLVDAFTKAGLECVVRLYAHRPHPHFAVSPDDVRAYVDAGAHYFEWGNEPNLHDEWDLTSWHEGAQVDKVCEQWLRNAEVIRGAGGIPCFPALSPGGHYPHRQFLRTAFEWLRIHGHLDSLEGAALAIHNRPLNHPLDYVDREGEPVPGCHFLDYEWIDELVRQYVGHSLPLLGTEAGYTWRDHQDDRYPEISPELHAQYNLAIFDGFRSARWRDALFCQCMWLCDHWGDPGHGFDLAHWHNNRVYGGDLPAVAALRADWQARPFERVFGWQKAAPANPLGPDPSVAYYHSERHGYEPEWIILHDTEGPAEAALAWWRSPDNPYKSSAHYLIKADGEVIVCVPERLSAHHAGGGRWPGIPEGSTGGTSNINHVSIGVELEYPAAPASPAYPEAQLAAAAELLWHIANRYGIPRDHVLTHAQVDPSRRSDPRGLDVEGFLDRVWPRLQPELPEDAIRNAAWNAKGIPYNPDAAFPRYAREHGLGNPETPEVDVDGVRLQGFSGGIVYAKIGHWSECRHIDW